jgi:hypothetical protein
VVSWREAGPGKELLKVRLAYRFEQAEKAAEAWAAASVPGLVNS